MVQVGMGGGGCWRGYYFGGGREVVVVWMAGVDGLCWLLFRKGMRRGRMGMGMKAR
jgi:hypothetical protein